MATTTTPPTALPPGFRLRRTISAALYGAVLECEYDAPPTPNLNASPGSRRRPTLAVKTVSLKLADKASLTSDRTMDDPWQEWKVASQLIATGGHSNVLQFYQQIEQDGTLFFASEYCSGGDLYEHIGTMPTGAMAENEALTMLRQIARGVQFLHDEIGIAHRDLSLENVLLKNGVCKLSDFGLSVDATRYCNDCVGKECYMAPEVVAKEEYDPCRADIWSLGIMLFIMLTGSPLLPLASRTERGYAALASVGVVPVLCAWGVRSELSDSCVDLLSQMLQVEPSKRIDVVSILNHPALRL